MNALHYQALKDQQRDATGGDIAPKGKLEFRVIGVRKCGGGHRDAKKDNLGVRLSRIWRLGFPHFGLNPEINAYRRRNIPNLLRKVWLLVLADALGVPYFYGEVHAVLRRKNGRSIELGMLSARVVTTAGVNFIVDAFQNSVELEILKYHGVGTGTNAEASGDTALQTESTTALNPDSTRATGSLTEGASANIFRTVGTVTFDNTAAITEHGILSQAATGGGTLLDRSVFSAINVVSGDSIQFTYDLTLTAGS